MSNFSCITSFDLIDVGGQASILPPAAGFLHQPGPGQIIQRPLHRGAGQAHPGRDGIDSRPAGALLVGVIFQVDVHHFGPVAQLLVPVDGLVVGQRIILLPQAAAHPAFSHSQGSLPAAALFVLAAGYA